MTRYRTGRAAGALALCLTLAACGGSGSGGLVAGEDYTVLGALAELPHSSAEGVLVSTGDLTAAGELAGLERPEDGEDFARWASRLSGLPQDREFLPVYVPLPQLFVSALERDAQFAEELGWSPSDVDAFTEMHAAPESFTVVTGDLPEDALAGLPEVADGVSTAGEGEDGQINPSDSTPARQLGVPLRMAQADSRLAASPSTTAVSAWVAGEADTFADHASYAAVAEALDEADVVGAVLGPSRPLDVWSIAGRPGAEDDAAAAMERLEEIHGDLGSVSFDVLGIGFGVEGEEAVVTLAYHFASEDAASEAAPGLERRFADSESIQSGLPLSDLVTVRDAAVDGPVAVLTLGMVDGRSPQTVVSMYSTGELPFVSP